MRRLPRISRRRAQQRIQQSGASVILSATATASSSSHEKRHDGKNPQHQVIDGSRDGVSGSEILSDRQAAKPEHKPEFRDEHESKRDKTHAKSARRPDGTARRWTIHRAATMVTTSMIGVSISSAFLMPNLGTTHSVRIVPSTKPA